MKQSDFKKYKVGLVIGRFQPFHLGHKFLIEEALKISEKIIIGVGSSNKKNKDNPWSSHERRKMLQLFVEHHEFENRILKIVNADDYPDDDVWFEKLYKKTGPFDVTLGNNDWNNGIIKRHGIDVIYTGMFKREELEGYRIRKLMREKKPWKERVPEYLSGEIRPL